MKGTKSLDYSCAPKRKFRKQISFQAITSSIANDYIAQNSTSDCNIFYYFYPNAQLRNILMVRRGKELCV